MWFGTVEIEWFVVFHVIEHEVMRRPILTQKRDKKCEDDMRKTTINVEMLNMSLLYFHYGPFQ